MHIYQSTHNCKSARHKDLKQGGIVKEDCDVTCSAAGGGGRQPIYHTCVCVCVPVCMCVLREVTEAKTEHALE